MVGRTLLAVDISVTQTADVLEQQLIAKHQTSNLSKIEIVRLCATAAQTPEVSCPNILMANILGSSQEIPEAEAV